MGGRSTPKRRCMSSAASLDQTPHSIRRFLQPSSSSISEIVPNVSNERIGLNESDATLEDNSHANISDTDSETSPITAYERKTLITELHTITGFEQKMLNIFDKMAKRRKNALKQMKGSDEKAAALYSLNHGLKTEISGLRGEMKSLKEKTELLIEKDVTNSKKIEDQNKRIEEQAKQIIELKEHINGLENQTDLLFKKLEDMKAYARERESK